MLLVTSNKSRQLLCLTYAGHVRAAELERAGEEMKTLLAELPRGFQLLVDLSSLDSMEMDCLKIIGQWMERLDQAGLALVVRVIPDPRKDLGFNILAVFHYAHRPRIMTCEKMSEAARHLGI